MSRLVEILIPYLSFSSSSSFSSFCPFSFPPNQIVKKILPRFLIRLSLLFFVFSLVGPRQRLCVSFVLFSIFATAISLRQLSSAIPSRSDPCLLTNKKMLQTFDGNIQFVTEYFDEAFRAWKSEMALRRHFSSHFGTLFENRQYILFYVSYDDDSQCAGFS